MSVPFVLAVVALAAALVRFIPGMLWPRHAMDGGYHMLLRREIRRHGMRMPARVEAMALDERQTYPWWYHWLLALVPESWLRRLPPLPSSIIDAVHAAGVAWLAAHVAPFADPSVDPGEAALAAGLLFASAPALLVVGIGPRAYEITPRPLGEICYTALMAAGGAYLATGSPLALGIAAAAGGVLLMSSKFAAQVLVLCAPIVAIVSRSPVPLLLVVAAGMAAFALSFGRYWWVLTAQVRHLAIFRRRLQHEHAILRDRNRWRPLGSALAAVMSAPGNRAAWAEFARLAEHNTVLQFLLRNVLWCGTVALALGEVFPAWSGTGAVWYRWLLGWAVAPVFPFLVSSLRRFRYIGEAERYPEYGVAAVSVLAAVGALALPGPLPLLLLALYLASLLFPIAYSLSRQRWNAARANGPGLDGVLRYLRAQPAGSVVLPVPWFAAYVLAPELEHRFLAGNDTNVWYRDYERIFARYPWPTPDIAYWRARGAQLALVEWPLLDADVEAPAYDLGGMTVAYEDARFRVYQLQ